MRINKQWVILSRAVQKCFVELIPPKKESFRVTFICASWARKAARFIFPPFFPRKMKRITLQKRILYIFVVLIFCTVLYQARILAKFSDVQQATSYIEENSKTCDICSDCAIFTKKNFTNEKILVPLLVWGPNNQIQGFRKWDCFFKTIFSAKTAKINPFQRIDLHRKRPWS